VDENIVSLERLKKKVKDVWKFKFKVHEVTSKEGEDLSACFEEAHPYLPQEKKAQ
jgi:hypothetical protein